MLLMQSEIVDRDNFGKLLTKMGLGGYAAEIGTHKGDFAEPLLAKWSGSLYCVDPWLSTPEYTHQEKCLWDRGKTRADDMEYTTNRLKKYNGRGVIIQATSEMASRRFEDGTLSFVYIDGDHRKEEVEKDMYLWWHKLRKGGVLAGHDFICPGEPDGGWGREIQPVVMRFAEYHRLNIWLVVEMKSLPWSFYLIKP